MFPYNQIFQLDLQFNCNILNEKAFQNKTQVCEVSKQLIFILWNIFIEIAALQSGIPTSNKHFLTQTYLSGIHFSQGS